VGNPGLLTYEYSGPAGQGANFAPGFDPANYTRFLGGNIPTANVAFADGMRSPITREFTVGLATPFGTRGSAKVSYQWRSVGNFVEDFVDDPTAAGKVTVVRNGVVLGTLDRVTFRNSSAPVRDYQALLLQGNRRLSSRWTVDGHWTVQLRNNGSFEGEAASQPGLSSTFGNYPEILDMGRSEPSGRLNDFQRHKVRAWTTYNLDFSRFGTVDASVLYRYNSALTYSLHRRRCTSASAAPGSLAARRWWTWPSPTASPCSSSCARGSRPSSTTCSTTRAWSASTRR
jgi:hypothetical protein